MREKRVLLTISLSQAAPQALSKLGWTNSNNPNQEKINERVKIVNQHMKAEGILCSLVSLSSLSSSLVSRLCLIELLWKGWIRNLLREGVEPNPGPTFLDMKRGVTEAFTSAYKNVVEDFFKWLASQLEEGEDSDDREIEAWLQDGGNAALSLYTAQKNQKQRQKVVTRFLQELYKNSKIILFRLSSFIIIIK